MLTVNALLDKDLLQHASTLVHYVNFCEVGTISEIFTCTQRIQEWNKPRDKKLTVTDLKEHKIHANAVNLNC